MQKTWKWGIGLLLLAQAGAAEVEIATDAGSGGEDAKPTGVLVSDAAVVPAELVEADSSVLAVPFTITANGFLTAGDLIETIGRTPTELLRTPKLLFLPRIVCQVGVELPTRLAGKLVSGTGKIFAFAADGVAACENTLLGKTEPSEPEVVEVELVETPQEVVEVETVEQP